MRVEAGRGRGRLYFLARLLVSAGLVFYLAWIVDWRRAFDSIGRADKLLLAFVPLITLTSFAASALRWQTILADSGVRLPWFQAFRGYVLALFYGTFLPGVLGGDAIRVGICVQKTHCPVGTATAAVLLERVGGVVSLFCLLFFAYFAVPQQMNGLLSVQSGRLIFAAGAAGFVLLLVVILTRTLWVRWLPDSQSASWAGRLVRFVRSFAATLAVLHRRSLWIILFYCIIFQLFDIAATFTLARAIGLQLSPAVFLIVVPLTYLVLLLPVSLGGLGVREGTMTFLLSHFGVSTSEAVLLSFLIYLNRMLIGLLGGGLQLIALSVAGKNDPQAAPPA